MNFEFNGEIKRSNGEIERSNYDTDFQFSSFERPQIDRTLYLWNKLSEDLANYCKKIESENASKELLTYLRTDNSPATTVKSRAKLILAQILNDPNDFKISAPKTKKFSREHFAKPKSQSPANSSRFHKSVHQIPTKTKKTKAKLY